MTQDWKKRIADELTHRADGKKPQLHPTSMWNVKLIFLVEDILQNQTKEIIGEIESERPLHLKISGVAAEMIEKPGLVAHLKQKYLKEDN